MEHHLTVHRAVVTEKKEAADREMEAFIRRHPRVEPEVESLRMEWGRMLSRDRLSEVSARDIKEFVRSGKAGNPGNQQSFNREWNRLGDERAADHVRKAFMYLLYGPDDITLERRLDDLLLSRVPQAMSGLKEGLLTKALAIGLPERFIPILYVDRKLAILEALWGLRLATGSLSHGKLVIVSNDLLRELSCPPFENLEHAASFLFNKAEPRDRSKSRTTHGSSGGPVRTYGTSSFRCTRCNLVKPKVQLADSGATLCVDCA